MTRMERLSALYGRLSGVAAEPNPELNHYFDHFRRLDFGSVYPLLLALYEDYEDGQFALSEFVASMGILLSFILRRMVVGVPSNSLSGLFIALCKAKPVTETPSAWLSSALGAREQEPPMAHRCGVRGPLGSLRHLRKPGVPSHSRMP